MRFIDDNIRLKIYDKEKPIHNNNKILSPNYSFRAYLEKSDVQIKTLDTNIQYAPLNFTNNTQFLKVQYQVDFSFNVFAEDREEAIQNYDQLHSLLQTVKPSYKYVNNQYLPNAGNIFGLLSVEFSGLPRLSKRSSKLDIYVTNFAYTINKDMGYLQAPYNPYDKNSPDRSQLFVTGQNNLIPIAYKLDISGRVLLSLDESIKGTDGTNGAVAAANKNVKSYTDILNKLGTDPAYQEQIINIAKTLVGDKLYDLSTSKLESVLKKVKQGKDKYLIGLDGQLSKYVLINGRVIERIDRTKEDIAAYNKLKDAIIKDAGNQ